MKAIRVEHVGGPEVMKVVDVPAPQAKAAEAVVRVNVAGVNSIDAQFRDGRLRTPLPFIPGQEGAGVVTEVGPQVKALKVWSTMRTNSSRVKLPWCTRQRVESVCWSCSWHMRSEPA